MSGRSGCVAAFAASILLLLRRRYAFPRSSSPRSPVPRSLFYTYVMTDGGAIRGQAMAGHQRDHARCSLLRALCAGDGRARQYCVDAAQVMNAGGFAIA